LMMETPSVRIATGGVLFWEGGRGWSTRGCCIMWYSGGTTGRMFLKVRKIKLFL